MGITWKSRLSEKLSFLLLIRLFVLSIFVWFPQTISAVAPTGGAHGNKSPAAAVAAGLIVKFKPGVAFGSLPSQILADKLSQIGNTKLNFKGELVWGSKVFKFEKLLSLNEASAAAEKIQKNPNVLYAEPDVLLQPAFTPNDPFFPQQWHYQDSMGGINLPKAWNISKGKGVVVAVLDTGVIDHEDLPDTLPGYDFVSSTYNSNDGDGRDPDPTDPGDWVPPYYCLFNEERPNSWHGTHVSGTIAALTDNGIGVSGVAPEAKLLPVRVLGRCGAATSDIADAMLWSTGFHLNGIPDNPNPAKVLNMSLGGPSLLSGSVSCSETLKEAVWFVTFAGSVAVVAAGNDYVDVSTFQPANCPGVISVAAIDKAENPAYYSNFGNNITISAPGGELPLSVTDGVLSTLNTGQTSLGNPTYRYYQGTSMAAAHVSGVIALLYSINPSATPLEILTNLVLTAREFPVPCPDGCGAGIVDAYAAVKKMDEESYDILDLIVPIIPALVNKEEI